jgi:hypothetical protein
MPTPFLRCRQPDRSRPHRSRSWLDAFLANGGMVILLLAVAVVCTALAEPRFLNRMNLINLGRNFSFLLIPAMAQTLVMTVGGFDLSVGMVAAAGSVVSALTMGAVAAWMPGADLVASRGGPLGGAGGGAGRGADQRAAGGAVRAVALHGDAGGHVDPDGHRAVLHPGHPGVRRARQFRRWRRARPDRRHSGHPADRAGDPGGLRGPAAPDGVRAPRLRRGQRSNARRGCRACAPGAS